jgi:hypothetical protein
MENFTNFPELDCAEDDIIVNFSAVITHFLPILTYLISLTGSELNNVGLNMIYLFRFKPSTVGVIFLFYLI